MDENENKNIIGADGKALSSNKLENIKLKINDNIWNILGTGIGTCITVLSLLSLLVSTSYVNSCSSYYGVSRQYFNGSEVFIYKAMFAFSSIVLFLYPFFFNYLNKKMNSKVFVCFSFGVVVLILFYQNLLSILNILNETTYEWLKNILDSWATIIFFLIADIVISFYIIIRNYFWNRKPVKKFEEVIFSVALFIYLVSSLIGIGIELGSNIEDKTSYETIDDNKVIVSIYEGNFLVMDCEVKDNILYIKRGKYHFMDMTMSEIAYNEYEKVVCK